MQDERNASLKEQIRLLEEDNAAMRSQLANYNNSRQVASEQERAAHKRARTQRLCCSVRFFLGGVE
jgi:hypothetical protein